MGAKERRKKPFDKHDAQCTPSIYQKIFVLSARHAFAFETPTTYNFHISFKIQTHNEMQDVTFHIRRIKIDMMNYAYIGRVYTCIYHIGHNNNDNKIASLLGNVVDSGCAPPPKFMNFMFFNFMISAKKKETHFEIKQVLILWRFFLCCLLFAVCVHKMYK